MHCKRKGRLTEVHGIAAEVKPGARSGVPTTETILIVTLGLLARLFAEAQTHGDLGRAPDTVEALAVTNLNQTGLVDGIIDHITNLDGDVGQRETARGGALDAGVRAASKWQHDCGWRRRVDLR